MSAVVIGTVGRLSRVAFGGSGGAKSGLYDEDGRAFS